MTSDYGREFAQRETIAWALKAKFYFAHPYVLWKCGTNENTNSLIRQYFPRNGNFTTITKQEIELTMIRLNIGSRKRFGYLTPNQVFMEKSIALRN